MKALILNGNVVQISNESFEVASGLSWVECNDNTEVGMRYDGTTFFLVQLTDEDKIKEKIADSKEYLTSTDYKVLPDYDGNTTGILEARAEARAYIRANE